MKPLDFILLQSESLSGVLLVYFLFAAIAIVIFLITRGVMLWYWKIDVMIRNQEYANDLLIEQNKLLKEIIDNRNMTDLKNQNT